MLVKYEIDVSARCLTDHSQDAYSCYIIPSKPVYIEEILDIFSQYANKETTQDGLCEEASRELLCQINLVGWHLGVHTEVTRGES